MIDLTKPDTAYWVVTAQPGEGLHLAQCNNPKAAADVLKALPEGSQGVVIAGTRLQITRAPHRFLKVPDQPPIPLFEIPNLGEIDYSVDLGHGKPPKPIVDKDYEALIEEEAAKDAAATAAQEGEEDEEEEGLDELEK